MIRRASAEASWVQRVIYVKSMRWGALGPLRPLRGSRAPSCDFASQSSSLRSSGDLTASPQVHLALRQPDACRRGRMTRDHEPCERRVALWQHSAVSPRHGLRRCLASRVTTAAPAVARQRKTHICQYMRNAQVPSICGFPA